MNCLNEKSRIRRMESELARALKGFNCDGGVELHSDELKDRIGDDLGYSVERVTLFVDDDVMLCVEVDDPAANRDEGENVYFITLVEDICGKNAG